MQDLICGNSELAREKMWSRIHLIPLLQAEEDRDLVRRHYAQQKMEEELLGKAVPVYNSDRYGSYVLCSYMDRLTPLQIRAANICCDSFKCNEIDVERSQSTCQGASCIYHGVRSPSRDAGSADPQCDSNAVSFRLLNCPLPLGALFPFKVRATKTSAVSAHVSSFADSRLWLVSPIIHVSAKPTVVQYINGGHVLCSRLLQKQLWRCLSNRDFNFTTDFSSNKILSEE